MPVRAFAEGGEVLVWVTGGYLSALEYAWTTDAVPVAMPPHIRSLSAASSR